MKVLFLLVLWFLPLGLAGQQAGGGTFLAMQHKDFKAGSLSCKATLRYLNHFKKPYASVLYQSFGKGTSCLRAYTKKIERPHILQFFASNDSGRFHRKLYPHEFLPGVTNWSLMKAIRRNAPWVKSAYLQQFSDIRALCSSISTKYTTCLLALALESRYDHGTTRRLIGWAKEAGWDWRQIVYNPVRGAAWTGRGAAGYLELHGVRPQLPRAERARTIVSLDGNEPSLCDQGKRPVGNQISGDQLRSWLADNKGKSGAVGLWCSLWQGRTSVEITDPRSRRCLVRRKVVDRLLSIMLLSLLRR